MNGRLENSILVQRPNVINMRPRLSVVDLRLIRMTFQEVRRILREKFLHVKPRFKWHLSSCIRLSAVASVLVLANTWAQARTITRWNAAANVPVEEYKNYGYGWPFASVTVDVQRFEYSFLWLAVDTVLNVTVLAFFLYFFEVQYSRDPYTFSIKQVSKDLVVLCGFGWAVFLVRAICLLVQL
jgi:hypothetical protein